MSKTTGPFTEWLDRFEREIKPLSPDHGGKDGSYQKYDEAYNTHLEELHELVRDQAALLDSASGLLAALESMANRMASMMREYELPEECNGIICGELDAANAVIAKANQS